MKPFQHRGTACDKLGWEVELRERDGVVSCSLELSAMFMTEEECKYHWIQVLGGKLFPPSAPTPALDTRHCSQTINGCSAMLNVETPYDQVRHRVGGEMQGGRQLGNFFLFSHVISPWASCHAHLWEAHFLHFPLKWLVACKAWSRAAARSGSWGAVPNRRGWWGAGRETMPL